MLRIVALVLFLLSCLGTGVCCYGQEGFPGIIPAPEKVELKEGIFRHKKIRVRYSDEGARKEAELFADYLSEVTGKRVKARRLLFRMAGTIEFVTDTLGREAYRIDVSAKNIRVQGEGAGLFYGLQSLIQMHRSSEDGAIHCVSIEDKPRFRYRGIMQDVGYHIYPVDFIKKEIDLMARYKMNVFHWHLTEDHGWRIEIKSHPELTEISSKRDQTVICNYNPELTGYDSTPYGGYYTQDEVRDIVEYARQRHIVVIPEIEMPGHTLAVLAANPHLACGDNPGPFKVAQSWGIFEDVFCAGKEETFKFLKDVLDEVMELFPGEYIHIGGDECPKDRWKKCYYCQNRIKQENLKDEDELQSWFIQRIEKYVNSKGRRIIGWDEILEGGLAENATVMSWRGTEGGIMAARQRHDVIMAPTDYLYLDYIQGPRSQEPLAIGWGFNPTERIYEYEPVPEELTAAEAEYIVGVEGPIWTEHMDTERKVSYMLLPRLMALAEVAWSFPERKDLKEFKEERLPVHLGWIDAEGLVYRVPEPIGMSNQTLFGSQFILELKSSVKGGNIYYNFDGQEPRETDFLYDRPINVYVPEGEAREVRSLVIAPSGKRSISVTTRFENK